MAAANVLERGNYKPDNSKFIGSSPWFSHPGKSLKVFLKFWGIPIAPGGGEFGAPLRTYISVFRGLENGYRSQANGTNVTQ